MADLIGKCDCGQVTITISDLPNEINACPCDYCRRVGARWGYLWRNMVTVTGETTGYGRMTHTCIFHHCTRCGVLTHWITDEGKLPHMGVHMENFDPDLIRDIPVVIDPP